MTNTFSFQTGDQVYGEYHNVPFTGTVTRFSRPHTANYKLMIVDIDTDFPVSVYGEKRDSVMMEVQADGTHTHTSGTWVKRSE